jgi:DNA-binding response OmpR family regulator
MGRKILVIEDEPSMRESLRDLLSLEGIECEVASCAYAGLQIAEKYPLQMVITDIQLPDMSGYEVCQRLKRDTASKRVPVVMMTGRFTEPQDRVQGFELGAEEFFCKPFDPVYFIAKIKSILRQAA